MNEWVAFCAAVAIAIVGILASCLVSCLVVLLAYHLSKIFGDYGGFDE